MSRIDRAHESDSRLGPIEDEFAASRLSQFFRASIGFIFLIISASFFTEFIIRVAKDDPTYRKRRGAIGFVGIVGAYVCFRAAFRAGRTRVDVFADGLMLHQEQGARSCRWDEIVDVVEKENEEEKEYFSHWMAGEGLCICLRLRAGEDIILGSYIRELERLGRMIKRATLPYLLPDYRAQLRQRGVARFGSIRIERDGIEVEEEFLCWEDVENVESSVGWVKVYRRSRRDWDLWRKVKIAEVPNSHVMLAMADDYLRE